MTDTPLVTSLTNTIADAFGFTTMERVHLGGLLREQLGQVAPAIPSEAVEAMQVENGKLKDALAPSEPTPTPAADEREAFEAWYAKNVSYCFADDHHGAYHDAHAVFGSDVWNAWQARASLAAVKGSGLMPPHFTYDHHPEKPGDYDAIFMSSYRGQRHDIEKMEWNGENWLLDGKLAEGIVIGYWEHNCPQQSPSKPEENIISGEGLNTGAGFIWNGREFLRVAPGVETFAMLAMERTLFKEIQEEEALLIMQAGILEVADPAQPLDAGTALVLAYRALTKEARIIPRAGQQTKEHAHG